MTGMKDLSYDIEQLYIEGFSPVSIAAQLQCPLSMIYDWLEAQNVQEGDEDAQLV
jgi:hypothetical protein